MIIMMKKISKEVGYKWEFQGQNLKLYPERFPAIFSKPSSYKNPLQNLKLQPIFKLFLLSKYFVLNLALNYPLDIKNKSISYSLSSLILISNNISKKIYHSVWVQDDARLVKTESSKPSSWNLCKLSMYINIYDILELILKLIH